MIVWWKSSVWGSVVWFQELDLHHGERLGKVEMAVSRRNIPSVCLLTVWLLKRVCRAQLPARLPVSLLVLLGCFTGSSVWGDGHPRSTARFPQQCMRVFICSLVCPRVWPLKSQGCSHISTSHRLCSSELRAGPQLAGCGLCVARVISSALRLRPGVDKIWIPYWCCHMQGEHIYDAHSGHTHKHELGSTCIHKILSAVSPCNPSYMI